MECHGKLENFHQALHGCWSWGGGQLIQDSSAFLELQRSQCAVSHKHDAIGRIPLKHGTIINVSSSKHVQRAVGICICACTYRHIYRIFMDSYLMQTRYTLDPHPEFLISLDHTHSWRITSALPKRWPWELLADPFGACRAQFPRRSQWAPGEGLKSGSATH